MGSNPNLNPNLNPLWISQNTIRVHRVKFISGGYGNEVFAAVSLQDRVYTFGGYWKNGTQSDVAFMFRANVWSQVGTLQARDSRTAQSEIS